MQEVDINTMPEIVDEAEDQEEDLPEAPEVASKYASARKANKPQRKVTDQFRRAIFANAGKARYPRLSRKEELELIIKAQEGCSKSAKKIAEFFMLFLSDVARNTAAQQGHPELEEDMFAEGLVALHKCILDYDPARSARFYSALAYAAGGRMLNCVLRFAKPFSTGTGSDERKAIYNKKKFLKDFSLVHGRRFDGSHEDYKLMSEITEISDKALKRGFEVDKINTIDVTNLVMASPEEHMDVRLQNKDRNRILRDSVNAVRAKLSDRNRSIFDALSDVDAPSNVALASKHDITPERVGQIYRQCTKAVRDHLASKNIHATADLA